MGSMVQFNRTDGQPVPAYEARATADKAPGVVVIQEWWGLNDQIRGVADRLAAVGYHAVVPDLYRGKVTTSGDEASHLMSHLDWDVAVQDIGAGAQYLKGTNPKAGIMGFCTGGALALMAAGAYPDLSAGVVFYGIPPEGKVNYREIKVPLLLHYATHDGWCNPDAVSALEFELKSGKVNYDLYRYDAQHAFMNDRRPEVYNEEAANTAWQRTIAFINQHLHGE
ncbi:MAG TPA: dienelactone hydrolase family protein [bacterium]|nr:dienelactone hydrolase family protein [bacterium]